MKLREIKSPLPSRLPPEAEKETGKKEAEEGKENRPIKVSKKVEKGKRLPVWLIGIVGVGVAIGAGWLVMRMMGINKETGSKKVELIYWGLWEEPAVMEGAIADFESKNPNIKVKYVNNASDNYRSRLAGRLKKSGQEIEVPDIFRIHSSWLPMFADELEIVPKDTVKRIGLEEDFYQVYKKDLKKDGGWLAVPLMYDGLSLFYNKKLLREAKVEVPKTWWGLMSAAQRLTKKDETGQIVVAGAALGEAENVDHWSDVVGVMLKQTGADLTKSDSENRKLVENVLLYYTMFSKGENKTWDESLPKSTQFFASGNLGFYFGPSWRVFNLADINPGLEYGIARVPQLPTLETIDMDKIEEEAGKDNITDIHWASYWVEAVNGKSKKKAEAFAFLEYLASKEGLERMFTAASQIRSFGLIYPRVSMKNLIEENEKIKSWVEVADKASSGYLSSRTFDEGINDEMSVYFRDAINKINRKTEAMDEVMESLFAGINQVVNKYKLANY